MRFEGKVWKDGKFWLIEVPLLDVMTQGHTRTEAFEMIKDAIESLINQDGFEVVVHHGRGDTFEVSANDIRPMLALMLKRKRVAKGVSLGEAISRLGQSSKMAFARYERGKAVPSVIKLAELFAAVSQGHDLVLRQSEFADPQASVDPQAFADPQAARAAEKKAG